MKNGNKILKINKIKKKFIKNVCKNLLRKENKTHVRSIVIIVKRQKNVHETLFIMMIIILKN